MSAGDLTSHFMGSVTVGERGQVVIPAEARERLDIQPGDKLLVFSHPAGWGVAFCRFDRMQEAQAELTHVLAEIETSSSVPTSGEVAEEESI
ncbi:MAG: AbrB/MazE/SpoVT family DNA-binding domain-containing protein [Armatimonadota bacterium]